MRTMVVPLALLAAVLLLSGCSQKPSEAELLKSATFHHGNDDFDAALADFQQFTQLYPKSSKMPEALYAMAIIYQNEKKEFARAESLYTKLAMEYPGEATAQGASYQRARILAWNLHKPDSARVAYQLFLQRYPDVYAASSAKQELDSLNATFPPGK
ncbi:MAG TPA: tetratricopeptide repeat protein [Bacteroidota bacterium]|nr:tetratricopeptide repeat protein [Bacteroidota bacterium]